MMPIVPLFQYLSVGSQEFPFSLYTVQEGLEYMVGKAMEVTQD